MSDVTMLRVRIPNKLAAHLDAEVKRLQAETPAAEATRSSVVRYALEVYLNQKEESSMNLNATILQHAENISLNGKNIEDLVKEFFNCENATVDDIGDIWIEGPQAGHWLRDEEKENFIKWLQTR